MGSVVRQVPAPGSAVLEIPRWTTYPCAMTKPEIPQRSPYVMQIQPGTYAWCACGRSKAQPYCDGSHAGTGLVPQIEQVTEAKTVAWCGCKYSHKKPFCDGSHKNLA